MLYRTRKGGPPVGRRRGVAAVEFAVVSLFLVPLLIGLWEVGRLVEVQQYLNNAAREAGRQASTHDQTVTGVQNTIINYCAMNGVTVYASDITFTNLDAPCPYQTNGTGNYLSTGSGTKLYIQSDANGTYVTDPKNGNAKVYVSVDSINGNVSAQNSTAYSNLVSNNKITSDQNPQDAHQLDRLRVSVNIPFNRVRWILLNQITPTQTLYATVQWRSMKDQPLTVNTNLPLQ